MNPPFVNQFDKSKKTPFNSRQSSVMATHGMKLTLEDAENLTRNKSNSKKMPRMKIISLL
jgi:hypothetical protein